MTEETVSQAEERQDASECCVCGSHVGQMLASGVLSTARHAGKALRVVRKGLNAVGDFAAASFQERKVTLTSAASKAVRHAQDAIRRLEKQVAMLSRDLEDCLAQNVKAGIANPAEEANAREIALAIETAKREINELQDCLDSVRRSAQAVEDRIASFEDAKNTCSCPEEAQPETQSAEEAQPDAPPAEAPRKSQRKQERAKKAAEAPADAPQEQASL